MIRFILLAVPLLFLTRVEAQTSSSGIQIDSLPESRIDIPIQVNLKPIFALAEKNVDTVFTSPDYPNGWVQSDCATRYKYHFRRSPLSISMSGTTMNLGFMGYYRITGSTRSCVGGVVLSPWTPPCRCGFDEGERKVNIGFRSTFKLYNNYMLHSSIERKEPVPMDRCSVCFWGEDITKEVMKGLKAELDASKKLMEDQYRFVNLRPWMQYAWNLLSDVYAIPGLGYFTLHPKKLRMQNINAQNDLLNINIGISATPVVSFERPTGTLTAIPDLNDASTPGGFNIFLEAALQYDSLSNVMNTYLSGKRFDVADGIFKKHIIVKEAMVSGDTTGKLLIGINFTGSFDGTVHFTGKPVYDSATRSIDVHDLDYDLRTKSLLLKTAKWLFNKKIINEMKKYTSFDLSQYYDTASVAMNQWLNREWTKGIRGSGSVDQLSLTNVYALPQHLLIRSNCAGKLSVMVSEINLDFKQ